jgi:DNA-binding transcriptional LysR family regulator
MIDDHPRRWPVTLRSQNLNLIPILQALLHAEGVVGAAHDVHLAQPTVSGALARLREALDDPILVRVGRGMRLTPRAQQLRAQVDKICTDIDLLFQPHTFDPTAAEHDFVIAAPDHLAYLLSKALIARLPYEAPGVRIRFVDVPLNLADLLHDGTVDLGVAGNFGIWPSVKFHCLFQERIVAAVAADHPLVRQRRVTSADLLEYPGIAYSPGMGFSRGDPKFVTGIPSLDATPQFTLGQFTDAVLLAVGSLVVARAPEMLVNQLSEIIPVAAVQVADEREFDAGMFWAPFQHDALEHRWLRTMVEDCLAAFADGVFGRNGEPTT